MIRGLLKGALGPTSNDSRFLLDVHRRDLPGEDTMARYSDSDEDWVSDEAGAHELYWTQERVIGGEDPIEMGKNNCGRGVGGSMVHYAGYCPRFHPSDFEIHTRDGVGVDWPISYSELQPHYQELERELPVAGQDWPWGDPHRYPFSPHPVSGAAQTLWKGAIELGIEMRAGPVGIVNGTFGNRPHCIYRGYCLQGCKVNAKASPYVTHLPTRSLTASRSALTAWRSGCRPTSPADTRPGSATSANQTAWSACSERRRWRWPATRSRPRGCC